MVKNDITHIISHTHWDREWYLPFESFRFRLVKMIDRCLEIFEKPNSKFKFWNLDGQTIVLEDYLEIKPENRERLAKLIKEEKIGIGPWYLLNSPWLQTGEGNIRNLLFGKKICDEFGVKPQNLGYIPDQFIIFPQMPQILKGFNIDHMAFSRSMNDQYEKYGIKSEFYWSGPDNTKITVFHLKDGYGMAGFLPNDSGLALNQLILARAGVESIPRSTNQVLMFNGSDHTDPDENINEIIDMWNDEDEIVEDYGIAKQSSWSEFFKEFWAQNPELKTISGEFSGHKYQFAAKGVYSNRMPIKQENFALHTLLEKYSEPFSTLSWILGNEYKYGFIQKAWKYLLQNQPHDSSWASSPDYVIHDMWTRFRWSRQTSDEVFRRSAHEIISRMKEKTLKIKVNDSHVKSSKNITRNKYFITVFNPSPHNRTDVAQARFAIKSDDKNKSLILRDSMGDLIPAKFTEHKPTGEDRELFRTFVGSHGTLPINMIDVIFLARGVPAMGYETYMIEPEEFDVMEEPIDETFVNGTDDFLENNVIKVLVEKNGSLTINDKETNVTYKNFNVFEDTGNKGCNYEYIPIDGDTAYTTKEIECSTKMIEACPAFSEIEIKIPWKLPSSIKEDHSGRSEEKTDFEITTSVRIYPGNNKRVDIRTEFINTVNWHQLRALFPTKYKVEKEFVKSPFFVMERPVDTPWDSQPPHPTTGTYPQHSFMGLYDQENSEKKSGLAILNKGLPEYETFRDSDKNISIALTLFRGQGQWVKHLNLNPNIETPDAQWLNKKVIAEYSIVPMKQNWLESKITKIAEDYIAPLRTEMHWDVFRLGRYRPNKDLPPVYSFIEIIKGEIELSALKRSENNDCVIIRVFNLKPEIVEIELKIGVSVISADFIGLDEESLSDNIKYDFGNIEIIKDETDSTPWIKMMGITPSILKFQLKAHKIGTIKLTTERNL